MHSISSSGFDNMRATIASRILETACTCSIPGWGADEQPIADENGNVVIIPAGPRMATHGKVTIQGTNNLILLGEDVLLDKCSLEIKGDNCAILIGSRSTLRGVRIAIKGQGAYVAIGEKLGWRGGSISNAGDGNHVIIGDDGMFAGGIILRTDDQHGIFDRATQARINPPKPIVIHEHVWLANGVRVGKGAVVGAGAVVAQLSLVTGAVEPHSLYGGMPARKLRDNIAWTRGMAWESVPQKFK